ncbi:MAG: site-2 protease family protein, partial [Acidimicrobiia bacterium]|nr:site-2 protease family protein [Acidimicrobiia bacterium]
MLGGIAAAVAIIVFVTAHEAGHFLAAKAVGMKATEFFFGFGPRLWSTRKGETDYGVKLIPLGGYVRIVGMNPLEEVEPSDMGRTYREKKFWEKSLVVLAGVGTNFLIAFILFFIVVMSAGVSTPTTTVEEVVTTVEVEGVEQASPAAAAGVESGDVILAVGDNEVASWDEMLDALEAAGGGPTTVTVDRDGEIIVLDADLIEQTTSDGSGTTGFLGVTTHV